MDPEMFYKDFPTRGQCKELDYQVSACLFYQMDQWTLFAISMSVFVLTYLCDFAFVMNSELTRHYRAVLVGRCCWKNCMDRHVSKHRRWFVWFCLFWLNQQVVDNGLDSMHENCVWNCCFGWFFLWIGRVQLTNVQLPIYCSACRVFPGFQDFCKYSSIGSGNYFILLQ